MRTSRHNARAMSLLVLALGCAPPPQSADGVSLVKAESPPGVVLQAACTGKGPELCFNATDDNCNGVIDEGCGLATGAVQFVIAWGDNPADVDITVTDPAGARVNQNNRATPSGLRLAQDCPKDSCYDQNIENVFFEGTDPPRGRYRVDVELSVGEREAKAAKLPVSVRFGARIGSRSYGAELTLGRGDRKSFTFDL